MQVRYLFYAQTCNKEKEKAKVLLQRQKTNGSVVGRPLAWKLDQKKKIKMHVRHHRTNDREDSGPSGDNIQKEHPESEQARHEGNSTS
jgi:hypothetical protein